MDSLYFEIINGERFVRIEPIALAWQNSEIDRDNNLIKARVIIKAGFSGQFKTIFETTGFELFKQQLQILYNNLKSGLIFDHLEHQLELKIKGDGIGHFNVDVIACKDLFDGSRLTFSLGFDQTQIKELVRQLDAITKQCPIVGDFKIKNT